MNLQNIAKGQTFKNYKELCIALEEPIKDGHSKKAQLNEWSKLFEYEKEGIKFIITNILNPFINEYDMVMKYGTPELSDYYIEHKGFTPIKKMQFKDLLNEIMEYKEIDGAYRIIKMKETRQIRNIKKMSTGLYQYIIPLILLKMKDNPNCLYSLTTHKLARTIDMINSNYLTISYNKKLFVNNPKMPINVESYISLNDYYERVDEYLKYYLDNALKLMNDAHMINYQKIYYIELVKNKKKIKDDWIDEKEERICRRATPEEIQLDLQLQVAAMHNVGINPLEDSKQQCYYGKKALKYKFAYQDLLDKYNEDKEYKIKMIYQVNEIVTLSTEFCNYCLEAFNTDDIINNFNTVFMNQIINNANIRKDKNEKKLIYNDGYIQDYTKLINITIPQDVEMLHKNSIVKSEIQESRKKYLECRKTVIYKENEDE